MAVAHTTTPTAGRPSTARPTAADRLRLVTRLAERLEADRSADALTLRAVTVLTDAADPARADAMRPHTGDASPLVERLSVWAARRADNDAVMGALAVLDQDTAA